MIFQESKKYIWKKLQITVYLLFQLLMPPPLS